jgi:hypothetical protein
VGARPIQPPPTALARSIAELPWFEPPSSSLPIGRGISDTSGVKIVDNYTNAMLKHDEDDPNVVILRNNYASMNLCPRLSLFDMVLKGEVSDSSVKGEILVHGC